MTGAIRILPRMPGLNIGYARVSTDQQDLTAQRDGPGKTVTVRLTR